MASSMTSLPIPLILLVHLHILEYPHANKPEYDCNIFEPRVRGLRERTKLLEDIGYFLVGCLEGSSKTILSTYPCTVPSDTVAFRISLTKYLEALRHKSIFPASKFTSTSSGKTRSKEVGDSDIVAWWWKDVPVRKSLLEECAGDKFERLLLSLSTHTLLKGVPLSTTWANSETYHVILRSQPQVYTNLLSKCKAARQSWSHSASLLLRREEKLKSLRAHLKSHHDTSSSKYASLSTERLVALADSKCHDLLSNIWHDEGARLALGFLTKLSGLEMVNDSTTSSDALTPTSKPERPTMPPQPLPIAAAHHPTNLKKIRKPVFSSLKSKACLAHDDIPVTEGADQKPSRSVDMSILAEPFELEVKMHQALTDAFARMRMAGKKLAISMKALEEKRRARKMRYTTVALDLWQPHARPPSLNFDTQPTPELFQTLSLDTLYVDGSLESRIDDIHEIILPPYPPIPDLSAPRIAAPEHSQPLPRISKSANSTLSRANSKATQASSSTSRRSIALAPPHKPSSFSQPLTSTPPATIKPRKAHAQKPSISRTPKMPRKSLRFSLAVKSRPSLFVTGSSSDEEDLLESDVHRIVRGTQDTSMEDAQTPSTPRAKAKPVNRIFTGKHSSTVKRPKQSFPLMFKESGIALPSLVLASLSFDGLLTDSDDDEWPVEARFGAQSGRSSAKGEDDDDATDYDEAPSMTLRDILLKADTTHFELLEDEYIDTGNASFDWG